MSTSNSIVGKLLGYYKPPSDIVHVGEIVDVKNEIVDANAQPEVIFVVKTDDTLEQVRLEDTVKDAQMVLQALRQAGQ